MSHTAPRRLEAVEFHTVDLSDAAQLCVDLPTTWPQEIETKITNDRAYTDEVEALQQKLTARGMGRVRVKRV